MPDFSHLILTRFNLRTAYGGSAAPDEHWLSRRFELFDKVCYPSVRGQSRQNFKWLIFFDAETPDAFKRKISEYATWDRFIVCYARSFEDIEITDVVSPHIDAHADYLITTRLDNDDAISVDFIENVQSCFHGQQGEFVNFCNGYILCKDKLYAAKQYANPFVSMIESTKSFQTVWCAKHSNLPQKGKVINIETEPTWVQVVHGGNVINRRGLCIRVPIKLLDDRFILQYKRPTRENMYVLRLENLMIRLLRAAKAVVKFLLFRGAALPAEAEHPRDN